MELRAPVVSQDVALLGSVQIGMKAFVPENPGSSFEPEQNVQSGQGQTYKTALWKLHVEAGWPGNSCTEAYSCTVWLAILETLVQRWLCTSMLLAHNRDCSKERSVKVSSLCFFPNSITAYLSMYWTQVIYYTEEK